MRASPAESNLIPSTTFTVALYLWPDGVAARSGGASIPKRWYSSSAPLVETFRRPPPERGRGGLPRECFVLFQSSLQRFQTLLSFSVIEWDRALRLRIEARGPEWLPRLPGSYGDGRVHASPEPEASRWPSHQPE